MEKSTIVNYTDKEIDTITKFAEANGGTVTYELAKVLAEQLGRKEASLRSKLNLMGLYTKKGATSKNGEPVELRKDIAKSIEDLLDIEIPGLADLPKVSLKRIRSEFQKRVA